MIDIKNFTKAFQTLMLSNGKEPLDSMLKIWYEQLKEYPENKILKAMIDLSLTSDGFPSVGKIIEIIKPKINKEAEAQYAWQNALAYASTSNYSDNYYVAKITKIIGGAEKLGRADYTYELPPIKKQFIKLYMDLIEHTQDYKELQRPQVKKIEHTQKQKEKIRCRPEQAEKNKQRVKEIISGVINKDVSQM